MTSTMFPTTAQFPTVQQFPQVNPDPRIGAQPFLGTTPTVWGPTADPLGRDAASALTGMGLPSTAGMTPDEATAQTQAALAKLATINPQLAEELAQQHANTGDSGTGWLGALKSFAGAFLSPALSMGGKILDVIGRTSHIVPQWFDPEDKGSWAEDIGQALSGEDKTNWNEVFQHRGVLENAGWLRAVVGFGLDVATDPLTWATLGAGSGVSTAEKATTAGRLAIEQGAHVATLAEKAGVTIAESQTFFTKAFRIASGQTDNIAAVRKYATGGMEEFMGAFGKATESEVRMLLGDAFETGARVYGMAYSRTLKGFLARGGEMTLQSNAKVDGKMLRGVYESVVKKASWKAYGDGAWDAGKAAAGAMGGVRFRYAVPFTQFRYLSPMVPSSWRMGLGFLGRFGAGLSGSKIVAGMGGESEELFARFGWNGLRDISERGSAVVDLGRAGGRQVMEGTEDEIALAKKILSNKGGRSDYFRSAFYSASDRAGQLTAHLSPGARVYRKGLGFYFYREGVKNAQRMREDLQDNLAYSIIRRGDTKESSGVSVREDLMNRFERNYGAKAIRQGHATPEDLRHARLYADYFGHPDIPRDEAELENWFWHSTPQRTEAGARATDANPAVADLAAQDAEYQAHQAVLDDMKRVLASVNPDRRAVLDDLAASEAFAKTTLERQGVDTGDAVYDIARSPVIHPQDVRDGVLGARDAATSGEYNLVLPSGTSAASVRQSGVGGATTHTDLGIEGVRLDLVGGGAADSDARVVLRGVHTVKDVNLEDLENVQGSDLMPDATLVDGGTATMPQIHRAIDAAENAPEAVPPASLHPLASNEHVRDEILATNRAELTTAALRRGPNPPDAVRFLRKGEPVSMVVLDPTKVHVLSEDAAHLLPQGGYARRTLSSVLNAKLGGEATRDGGQFFGTPGQVSLSFRRMTRDMTLPEAEKFIRGEINNAPYEKYGGVKIAENEDVFNWDVLASHHDYVNSLGDSYFSAVTGRVTDRMLQLGNLVPSQFGALAKSGRTMFSMPQATMKRLAQAEKSIQDLYLKMNQRSDIVDKRVQKGIEDLNQRQSLILANLEAGLSGNDVLPTEQLSAAMDNVVRTSAEMGRVVEQETARHAKHSALLDERELLTGKVEEGMHVPEFEELDQLIEARMEKARTMGMESPAEPIEHARWTDETDMLRTAQAEGRAKPVPKHTDDTGEVWIETRPASVTNLTNGKTMEIPGHRVYYATDETGLVVSVRDVEGEAAGAERGGNVVATTASDRQGNKYGAKLILAHWEAEGVKDFEGVKRVIGNNEYTEAGGGLNKWAAKRVLSDNGIKPPHEVQDMLDRGELFGREMPDGSVSILNKKGAFREGGTKVWSRAAIDAERADLHTLQLQLNDLRRASQGLPPARVPEEVYTHELTMEPYDVMAARRELEDQGFTGVAAEPPVALTPDEEVRRALDDSLGIEQGPAGQAPEVKATIGHTSEQPSFAQEGDYFMVRKGQKKVSTVEDAEGTNGSWLRLTDEGNGDFTVSGVLVPSEARGHGTAQEMYLEAAKRAKARGGRLVSDSQISPEAERVWAALRKKGYNVTDEDGRHVLDLADAARPVPALTDSERALTARQAAAARHAGQSTQRAQRATQATLTREAKAERTRGAIIARAQERLTRVSNEYNRAQAEASGIWSEMKPAAIFDVPPEGGFKGLRQVQIPGMGGVYVHPYMAEEMEYMFRGAQPNSLQRWWRQFVLGPWKRWATYRNPGFHVRNNFGAAFNNFLGGVANQHYGFSHSVLMARDNFKDYATRHVTDKDWAMLNFDLVPNFSELKGQLTYGDVSGMLTDMGMGRASTTSLAITMGTEGMSARGTASAAMGGLRKVDQGLRKVGSMTEDYHRIAAWAKGMEITTGDLYGARGFVMVRHGDYADLTETENWVKDLIPFYKWMRTNVPYQFRMLAENPGRLTAITDKSQTLMYTIQGKDRYKEEAKHPEWMNKGYNIPIPQALKDHVGVLKPFDTVTMDLPYTDLYNGAREYLSSVLPVARNVVESFAVHQSTFTGMPLGQKMVPLSGLFNLPGISHVLTALHVAQKGPNGGVYIPDTIDNVLSAIPLYSRFHNWAVSDPARVTNRLGSITSAMLGMSLTHEDVTSAEQAFYYDELLPAIARMKSMGYVFPTAQQLSDAGGLMASYGAQTSAASAYPSGVAGTYTPPVAA